MLLAFDVGIRIRITLVVRVGIRIRLGPRFDPVLRLGAGLLARVVIRI